MLEETFIGQLDSQPKEYFHKLHQVILEKDTEVSAEVGSTMSSQAGINYLQEGVFKYSLMKAKSHFSFHTMVMYTYPEIAQWLKDKKLKIKVQKGCINFKSFEDLPLPVFKDLMEYSSNKDFTTVVEKYKKKGK